MNWERLEGLLLHEHWRQLGLIAEYLLWHLLTAVLIFFIGKWLVGRTVALLRRALRRAQTDATLAGFVCNVAHIGLLVLVIMGALGQLGVPTTSAAALIGGAGLAVGLSLKDQLSNFAAGVLIILFRPFKVGDYIKVGGFEGFVREIEIVQTSLQTYANEEVIVPNSVVMGNSIVNKSSLPLWRAQVVVSVDGACDIRAAKQAVLQAALDHPHNRQADKAASVQITALSGGTAELTLWAWTDEADWWAFQCDLNERVLENLNRAGIKPE